jgi:hypothetical protein
LYRPTYRFLRGNPGNQQQAKQDLAALTQQAALLRRPDWCRIPNKQDLAALTQQAAAGEITLLSLDETRFPMVPTLSATLGVKGHRPTASTRDCKDLLYVFPVMNLLSAAVHCNTLESPKGAKKRTGQSKTRRLQEAFAAHLRHVGRSYPAEWHKEVVLLIDIAPWHAGKPVAEALAEKPHLRPGGAGRVPGLAIRWRRPWRRTRTCG